MTITPRSEYRQNLLWLSVGLVFLLLLWLLTPVLTPFVAAAVIGYMLNPGVDWLERRRVPRVLGVLIAITGVGLLIAALLLQIGTGLVNTRTSDHCTDWIWLWRFRERWR